MLLVVECRGLWLSSHTYPEEPSKILREIENSSAAIKILVKHLSHA